MPVDETTVTNITCDNPNCPHTSDLDPSDRIGWLFVHREEYGQPTENAVYDSLECEGQHAAALAVERA